MILRRLTHISWKLAIVLMVIFPFIQSIPVHADTSDIHHNMEMPCDSDEDCERQMQERCLEHCLAVADNVEQQHFAKTTQPEILLPPLENDVAFSASFASNLPHNHSPPIDPRLDRTTVQRE